MPCMKKTKKNYERILMQYNSKLLNLIKEEKKLYKKKKMIVKLFIIAEEIKFWNKQNNIKNLKIELSLVTDKLKRLEEEKNKILNERSDKR